MLHMFRFLSSLSEFIFFPEICVVSAVGSACGSSKEDPDFEKVS
jgi:hypothetical protein